MKKVYCFDRKNQKIVLKVVIFFKIVIAIFLKIWYNKNDMDRNDGGTLRQIYHKFSRG